METYIDEDLNERVFVSHESKKYLLAASVAKILNKKSNNVSAAIKKAEVPDEDEVKFLTENNYAHNSSFYLYPVDLVLEARDRYAERNAKLKSKIISESVDIDFKHFIDKKLQVSILENKQGQQYVLGRDVAKLLGIQTARVNDYISTSKLMSKTERSFLVQFIPDVATHAKLYLYEYVIDVVSNGVVIEKKGGRKRKEIMDVHQSKSNSITTPDFLVVKKQKGERRETIWLNSPNASDNEEENDNASNASSTAEVIQNGFESFEEHKFEQYLRVIKLMLETASDDGEIKHIVEELPWADGWSEDRELTIQDLLYSKMPTYKMAAFFNAIKEEIDPKIEMLAKFFKIK